MLACTLLWIVFTAPTCACLVQIDELQLSIPGSTDYVSSQDVSPNLAYKWAPLLSIGLADSKLMCGKLIILGLH